MSLDRTKLKQRLKAAPGSTRIRALLGRVPAWSRIRSSVKTGAIIYQRRIAPWIAANCSWLLWPAYLVIRAFRIRFLVNLPAGMGHNTAELDFFLRRRATGDISNIYRDVLFRYPNPMHWTTAELYGRHFWWIPKGYLIFCLLLPITMRFKKCTLDCGLSRLKWQLRDDLTYSLAVDQLTYLDQISKDAGLERWKHYYRLRAQTPNLAPLADGLSLSPELISFLRGRTDKLAIVHLKLHVNNATAAPSDPDSYLSALRFLSESGYQLIFVGREPLPDAFRGLDILNYSQSLIASYKHDIQLFSIADIAITGGSGIAFAADCLDVPLVYLDSWHIGMPMFSPKCVMVPALVEDRSTNKALSLNQQVNLYWALSDDGHESFPQERYRPRNASADEVLMAVKEALALSAGPRARTELQDRYARLDPKGLLPLSQARASHYFLEKHNHLLDADADNAETLSPPNGPQAKVLRIHDRRKISSIERIRLLPAKIRLKGVGWLIGRIGEIIGVHACWLAFCQFVFTRLPGFRRHNFDTLYVYYDLDLYPVSYDITYFLVRADIERIRLGLGTFHVVFIPATVDEPRNQRVDNEQIFDFHSRRWRFRHIVLPMASLFDACEGVTACVNRSQSTALLVHARHVFPPIGSSTWRFEHLAAFYRDVVAHLRFDGPFTGPRASLQSLRYVQQWIDSYAQGRKLIVITLRQYQVDPERNNNLDAWLSFARGLDPAIYAPVFIPDTDHAFDSSRAQLDGVLVFDAAAWNLELRIALYELAYLNMLINAGTSALCVLNGRCRYLMFKILVPNIHLASEKVLSQQGFTIGESPIFATAFQRWVWEPDRLEVIQREFAAMCQKIESTQVANRRDLLPGFDHRIVV